MIASTSPEPSVFKSNPPEKIPSLPAITRDPLSFGTSFKHSFYALSMSYENTLAFPSSRVIIETSLCLVSVARDFFMI